MTESPIPELQGLLACPFCDGEAGLVIPSSLVTADCADVYVQCDDCEVMGPSFVVEIRDADNGRFPEEEAEAIAAWNTRASLSAKDAEIAELKHEAELFDESHADQNRMVDRIADLIGLPHDQELDTTAFELWFSKIKQSAEHYDRVIAGLNKQLTEQFELSTKYVAIADRRWVAMREATILIDEVNERKPSRAFHGIGQALHAKLCTVRAILARALHENPESKA